MCVSVCVELKGLGADFVFGFVQSMDGERDPRNLLLAFQVAKSIIHRGYDLGERHADAASFPPRTFFFPLLLFDFLRTSQSAHSGSTALFSLPLISCLHLGKFTEELFEVTSCYFPIDFTPVSPCLLSWFRLTTGECKEGRRC